MERPIAVNNGRENFGYPSAPARLTVRTILQALNPKMRIAALSFLSLAVALMASPLVRAEDAPPTPNMVSVVSPPYCSEIWGRTTISFVAPGLKTATIKCWKQGPGFGTDSVIGTVNLDMNGKGSVVFPADDYPHGPITVRITGTNGDVHDDCYLQLYNKGGVSWNEGIPRTAPPAAAGMKLVFADDFNRPLSISSTDSSATYYDHKPPNGSQDFSSLPFSGFNSPKNPFLQVGNYLRIRADANKNSAGLISSEKNDASGIKVSMPCYFECRFIGPNAPGTWPAFWLLTDYMTDVKHGKSDTSIPVDELDIIEAVGGEGPGEPNATGDPKFADLYQITPHAWNQPENKALEDAAYKDMHDPISMSKAGVPSAWWESFHIYGCKVTETDTIYYLDNIEVARHPTLPTSEKYPLFFLINLATGGGWPTNLSRYNGLADMYVDYVRVYDQTGEPK
jgi:beta-glucanase (GH16 family)